MTIKQNGGIFGRNPEFNDVSVTDEITILENGVDVGGVRSLSGQAQLSGKTTGITFGAQSVLPTNGGSAIQNGTRDIGDASSFWRNVYVSTGVYFGSQTTATHLDDYEEGTWTPDPQDSSGNSGSAGTASGYYTKIGNVVFATVLLENIDTTGLTAGQDFRIYGLPYTSASLAGNQIFTGDARMNSVTFSGNPNLAILDSTDYIRIVESISGSASDFVVVSEIASGTADIYGTITYMAA